MVETGFILVVVVVEALDLKLHIDDPVGAVGVHLANGVWGTLAVGLLANPDAPAGLEGLSYTGSFKIAWHSGAWHHRILSWTAVTMTLTFFIIKKTVGLRVSNVPGDVPVAEAITVKKVPTFDDGTPKFTKVEIICKESRFEALKAAMVDIGITGMTVSHVLGCGAQKGKPEYYRGVQIEANLLLKFR